MSEPGQVAYPVELAEVVEAVTYKPGWNLQLREVDSPTFTGAALALVIRLAAPDSYHRERVRCVDHHFPVPPMRWNRRAWCRWVFDQVAAVERHERCEFFVVDGLRPYAPPHGPGGNNPYLLHELATDEERRTLGTGEVKPV